MTGLRPSEIELKQDGVAQAPAALVPRTEAGLYLLSYVPSSGRPGPVTLRVLRPGAKVRGRDGPQLRPRVIAPLSPVEAELAAMLEARPTPNALPCRASVSTFEPRSDGLHHTMAVEVPVADVQRLQLFARLLDAEGRQVQRYSMDRSVETTSGMYRGALRLVWTANIHLLPGRYVLEALVRDPETRRAGATTLAFESLPAGDGLRMSSVSLVSPTAALVVRTEQELADDPLFVEGAPLMPTLALVLPEGAHARVRFFVVVYPDASRQDPVSLRLELLRDGTPVGVTAIPLPVPDERGQIRYLGGMPVGSFHAGAYAMRLVARQSDASVSQEAAFVIGGESQAPIRLKP
jgi:hypothetical protein